MTDEPLAYPLGYLHAESLEAWEARTVAACEARGWGTRPLPTDKPKRLPQSPKPDKKPDNQ